MAPKELLAMKIKSDNIKRIQAHQILVKIVSTSFYLRQKFEINKNKVEVIAYLTTTLLAQCQNMLTHQVTFNREMIAPITSSQGAIIRKVIQKNYLTLINKDYNLFYPASKVEAAL